MKEYKIIAPKGKVIDEASLKEGKIEFKTNELVNKFLENFKYLIEIESLL